MFYIFRKHLGTIVSLQAVLRIEIKNMTQSTKEKILRVAQKQFAKHGYAGTSMGKIGKLAGVTHSLLFHYFTNKENLWLEVKHAIVDEANEAEILIPSLELSLEQFIEQAFNNIVKFYQSNNDLTRMIQWQRLERENSLNISITRSESVKRWLNAFKHYQDLGFIPKKNKLEYILTVVFSLALSFVVDNNQLIKSKTARSNYLKFCVGLLSDKIKH